MPRLFLNSAKRWSFSLLHPLLCKPTCSLSFSPHLLLSPASTVGDSWGMTHNAVQPCLQRGRLYFVPPSLSLPTPSQPPAVQTIHKSVLCIHVSPQVYADTWQIKGPINSLCWTISPHHQRMKNKHSPVGLARPGHLVGLSVGDWVAQSCSVWGLGWSHNCFLWADQPPEPLHNWLSGWYSPLPPPLAHSHQKATPSSPLFSSSDPSSLLLLLPPVCQSIHPHSCSPEHFLRGLKWSGWTTSLLFACLLLFACFSTYWLLFTIMKWVSWAQIPSSFTCS